MSLHQSGTPLCRVTVSTPHWRSVAHRHGRPGDLHAAEMARLHATQAAVSVVRITWDAPPGPCEPDDAPLPGGEPIACRPAANAEFRQSLLHHCRANVGGVVASPLALEAA